MYLLSREVYVSVPYLPHLSAPRRPKLKNPCVYTFVLGNIQSFLLSGWPKSSSKMVKICQSLAAEVKKVAKKRKEVVNHQKAFRKEGWVLLKPYEMLVLKSADRESESVPLHLIKSTHTKFDILKQFLPDDFLVGIMKRKFEERSSSFTISKGRAANGGSRNFIIERSAQNAITYLAVWTL